MALFDDSNDDPWDPENFSLGADFFDDRPAPLPLPHHGDREPFLKGPISRGWLVRACRLAGSGLHVAIMIRFLWSRFGKGPGPRWTLDSLARGLRASTLTVRRAMSEAERAGLVEVTRWPGRKVRAADIAIIDPTELTDSGSEASRPLFGPVPYRWIRPALLLPGRALATALACWYAAEWARSARFEFARSGRSGLGLSRSAADRGLRSLESARLVAVDRGQGRKPIVTILDVATPGSGA
jgi:DNA-binding transcriptional regulator YhcF (GntR family)